MLWPDFVGGTYQALSPVIAADTAVNLFTETREVPGSAKQRTMYGTPGLRRIVTADTTSCRGWFFQDGLALVTIGGTLYRFWPGTNTLTTLGTIVNDGGRVYYASNGQGGNQVGIVGGGQLKVLSTATMVLSAAIALPFANPVMMTFIDGYGLINQRDSPIVWYSALEDFTSWDALDFFARSNTSDNIIGIGVARDRVWCFGSETTTLFYDSGDADTPFLPYPGTTFQRGLVAPALLALYQDTFYWVAKNVAGTRHVVSATDPSPKTISTPPIERFLDACTTLVTAESLVYEQDGHLFFCLTAPGSPEAIQTYCYDAREQLWHARAAWNATSGVYTRWSARGAISIGGTTYVGDYQFGKLYILDLNTYDDDGDILRRERTTPYLSAENQYVFVHQFQLGTQPGVGLSTGQGSAPVVTLEISRDGARTWVNAGNAPLGPIGAYETRAIWRNLGRFISGFAVLRVTMTDPVKCVFGPGAWLRTANGRGRL
jgi:hypothetical protein